MESERTTPGRIRLIVGALVFGVAALVGFALWQGSQAPTVSASRVAAAPAAGRPAPVTVTPAAAAAVAKPDDGSAIFESEDAFLTAEKTMVRARWRIRWRVVDTGRFEMATGGESRRAESYLDDVSKSGLRNFFASLSAFDAVLAAGGAVSAREFERLARSFADLGIEVVEWTLVEVE